MDLQQYKVLLRKENKDSQTGIYNNIDIQEIYRKKYYFIDIGFPML